MKSFAIMSLGCKVTDYEATYIKNELLKEYKLVNFKDKADIYLIFSCCVTNTAEAKTRKFIHQAKRNNPKAYIGVIGCLPQIKKDLKELDDVDLVIGSTDKLEIINCIKNNVKDNLVKFFNNPKFENMYLDNYPGKDRAFLKIQDGCNQYCSYCVIPYARGPERSLDHKLIIKQAKALSSKFNEIVLTGIHTGRYNDNGYNLYNLLCDLVKINKLKTIRLSSIEITEISDEIINLIKENDKLAKHLHIPVQSCSTKILKLMNRPYSMCQFKERIEYIRKTIPNISISTDLIVGFPGETDELFNTTLNNLKKIKFSFIHVFPYSRKTGTVADKMDNHIDPETKKKRVKDVTDIQRKISLNFYKKFIEKNVDVLIEKNISNKSYGYSKQYFYVEINGIFDVGSIVKVKIISVNDKIIGEYVSK